MDLCYLASLIATCDSSLSFTSECSFTPPVIFILLLLQNIVVFELVFKAANCTAVVCNTSIIFIYLNESIDVSMMLCTSDLTLSGGSFSEAVGYFCTGCLPVVGPF